MDHIEGPQHMFGFGSPPWKYTNFRGQWQFYWLSQPLVLHWTHLFYMDLSQYPIDHKTLSTCCHVGCHVDFSSIQIPLAPLPSRSRLSVKWGTWTVSGSLTNHINLYIRVKGPRASSVKWLYHISYNLGPLHTRAKSRDHETCESPQKMSKSQPKTPPKSGNVVTNPQV